MRQHITKSQQAKLNARHWTADDPARTVRALSSDFMAQVETCMEHAGLTYSGLAKRLGVSLGRVSQVMNSPGNFTVRNSVLYTRAVSAKVAMVVYPVDEANVNAPPISGDVFRACWVIAGCPKNMFDVAESSVGFSTHSGGMSAIGCVWGTQAFNADTFFDAGRTAHTDGTLRLNPVRVEEAS